MKNAEWNVRQNERRTTFSLVFFVFVFLAPKFLREQKIDHSHSWQFVQMVVSCAFFSHYSLWRTQLISSGAHFHCNMCDNEFKVNPDRFLFDTHSSLRICERKKNSFPIAIRNQGLQFTCCCCDRRQNEKKNVTKRETREIIEMNVNEKNVTFHESHFSPSNLKPFEIHRDILTDYEWESHLFISSISRSREMGKRWKQKQSQPILNS